MALLHYQDNDFELNAEQSRIIQTGFYKCDDNKKIQIEGSFDINLIKLFLELIQSSENEDKMHDIAKHDIYMLFFLAKSWGINEYQTKFGNFLFGPEYKADINPSYSESIQKSMKKLSKNDSFDSYKIHSLKYQADIEFSSVLNEKCLIDILDDSNPWFYQSNPNDLSPYIIIYFNDAAHKIKNYTLKMSKLTISLLNSKKWFVEARVKPKKKSTSPVWKKIDTVVNDKNPRANELITRNTDSNLHFTAIKFTSKDKKFCLHSIEIECDPPLKLV